MLLDDAEHYSAVRGQNPCHATAATLSEAGAEVAKAQRENTSTYLGAPTERGVNSLRNLCCGLIVWALCVGGHPCFAQPAEGLDQAIPMAWLIADASPAVLLLGHWRRPHRQVAR